MGTTSPRAMFLGLDAMRGVAAVSVMLYHFSPFLSAGIILPGAYLAVDLFFVLSGFVICHAYHAKLEAGMGVSRFCAVRLIRLYPLYIAATTLGLLYIVARTALLHQAWAGSVPTLQTLVLSILFLPNPSDHVGLTGLFPFDLAAWSLFFELAVNLAYAVSVGWLTTRRLVFIAIGASVGLIIALFIYGSLDLGMTRRTLLGGGFRVLFSFTAGVLIYRFRLASPAARIKVPFALEGLLLFLIATFLVHPIGAWAGPFDLLCIVVAFPVAILVGSRIEPALTPRFSALLGYLSYPVYVLHTPIALIVAGIWKVSAASDPTAAMPLSGGMMVVAVLLGSYCLTRWYDVPLRAWLTIRLLKSSGRLPVQLGTGATTPSTAAS